MGAQLTPEGVKFNGYDDVQTKPVNSVNGQIPNSQGQISVDTGVTSVNGSVGDVTISTGGGGILPSLDVTSSDSQTYSGGSVTYKNFQITFDPSQSKSYLVEVKGALIAQSSHAWGIGASANVLSMYGFNYNDNSNSWVMTQLENNTSVSLSIANTGLWFIRNSVYTSPSVGNGHNARITFHIKPYISATTSFVVNAQVGVTSNGAHSPTITWL